MTDNVIGGGGGWIAGPIYPKQTQSKQDPAYDIKFTEKDVKNIQLVNKQCILLVLNNDMRLEYVCDGKYRVFNFLPLAGFSREATSEERKNFAEIASKKLQADPAAEKILGQMELDLRKLNASGALHIGCTPATANLGGDVAFEILDKNMLVLFQEKPLEGEPNLFVRRYKTVPNSKKGLHKEMPQTQTAPEMESTWIEVDRNDLQSCKTEINNYIPKLLANLNKEDPKYDEKLRLLNLLQEHLKK